MITYCTTFSKQVEDAYNCTLDLGTDAANAFLGHGTPGIRRRRANKVEIFDHAYDHIVRATPLADKYRAQHRRCKQHAERLKRINRAQINGDVELVGKLTVLNTHTNIAIAKVSEQ